MKQIAAYIQDFYREEFHTGFILLLALFLGISIAVNYALDFEKSVINSTDNYLHLFARYLAFYALPFCFSSVAYCIIKGKTDVLKNPRFWGLGLFTITILAVTDATNVNPFEAIQYVPRKLILFYVKCMNNLIQAVFWLIPALIYWFFADRKNSRVYGLRLKGFDMKPYFIILIALAPFVFLASFGSDFLRMYPRYRPLVAPEYLGVHPVLVQLAFEFCYGLAFVSVEFLFRGFMVMVFMKHLGRGSVFVMTTVYCFIHFQKPLLETISSIFGGLILGIISSYSHSVYGGIIIHLGVAWLMEAAAFIQILLLKRHI